MISVVFFVICARFWRSERQTDLKISFRIKFCSRYIYPEVSATRNREKKGRTRPPPALLPRLAPGLGLARAPWLLGGVCVAWDSDKYYCFFLKELTFFFFVQELTFREFKIFFEISNGRLPPEQSSDRRETLAKRVSDNLQLFIFRRWK